MDENWGHPREGLDKYCGKVERGFTVIFLIYSLKKHDIFRPSFLTVLISLLPYPPFFISFLSFSFLPYFFFSRSEISESEKSREGERNDEHQRGDMNAGQILFRHSSYTHKLCRMYTQRMCWLLRNVVHHRKKCCPISEPKMRLRRLVDRRHSHRFLNRWRGRRENLISPTSERSEREKRCSVMKVTKRSGGL